MNTRKDFEAAAIIVAGVSDSRERAATARAFSEFFTDQNPRFDQDRFLAAIEDARTRGLYVLRDFAKVSA